MKKGVAIMLLLLGLAIGSTSIAIVWMRLQISESAKVCGRLEDEREVVMREVQELRGQRSWALRPSVLASMVRGRLSMPGPSQTFVVGARELSARTGGLRSMQVSETLAVVSRSNSRRQNR